VIKNYTTLKLTILCMVVFLCFNVNGFGQTPANDCTTVTAGAQLTVGATCTTTPWDSTNGTNYWQSNYTCNATNRDDAWGWFTATSTLTTITYTSTLNAIVTLFTGACSPTMTSLACADNTTTGSETMTYPTVIGTIYMIRIQRINNNNDMLGNICVYNTPNPCSNILPYGPCGTTVNALIPAGSGAYNPPATNCGFFTPGIERIYTFTPTTTGNYTLQQNSSFGWIDYFYKVASAGCSGTGWTCIGAGNGAVVSGPLPLTAGTTYYFMLDPETTVGGNVNFVITCPPPPLTNDDPCSAINLTSSTTSTCTYSTYTNAGATATTGVTAPGCANYLGGDVWFTTTIPASGEITIDTNTGVMTDSGMAVYSGGVPPANNCSALGAPLACDDDGSPNGLMSSIRLTGRPPGEVIYIRVWEFGNNNNGTFGICVTRPCVLPGPIVTIPTCGVVAGGLSLGNVDPAPIQSCTGTGCVDIEANFIELGNTTSYRVEQIPYNLPATGALLPIAGLTDDTWSNIISFPTGANGWDFCFYGTPYSQFVYGANGVISFNTALAGNVSGYETNFNVPGAINATDYDIFGNPRNYYYGPSIFGVHHDIDPSVNPPAPLVKVIGRSIDNTPGCERMIIVWENVPMYAATTVTYSGKMVLYKNTNIIEIYITRKNAVRTWNKGRASVAIQNNATTGLAAPCRNSLDYSWTTTNEAWRFVPNAGDITELRWLANGAPMAASTNNQNVINVCPSSTTTYTAQVTYTPACGPAFIRSDDVVVTVRDKEWNGSVSTNWYLPANWTPTGVPTATDCVIIPDVTTTNNRSPIADVVVAGGTIPLPPSTIALARTLTIRANGSLQVNANTFVEVVDAVTVDPAIPGPVPPPLPAGDFLIRSSGSLVQVTDVAANNNSGNIRMQRTVLGGVAAQNYVYWAAPVEGFSVENINTAASELRFEWNPTVNGIHNGTWISTSGPMTVGKGYIVRGLDPPPAPIPADTAEFVGRPSNGMITTQIRRGTYVGAPYTAVGGGNNMATNIDDNWNLVGNPYPSAISGSAFISANTSPITKIKGTIYLWSHLGVPAGNTTQDPFYGDYVYNYLGSDYVAYNGVGPNPPLFNGNIAAGQSFFVEMDDAVGTAPNYTSTVTFNNAMRFGAPANDNFLRTSERHRIWLDLVDQTNDASSTLIGYVTDATNDKDHLYDGSDLSDTSLQFYSLIGEEEMTIQGRALPFDLEDRVPLGFVVPHNNTYKIAINSLDGLFGDPSQNIYVEDTYLHIISDLRAAPYTFTSESGSFNDRFILRYTKETLSTPEQVANFGFNIIGLKDFIKVTSSNNQIKTVIVYDVLGRVLADYKDINALEFKIDFVNQSKGALIVKATLVNGQQKIKKVIY
jgi:hypothetical protein